MKEVLKKIFETHPGKSTMTINGKCSDCGRKVTVVVEPTSGGYGLMGGVLDKTSSENYSITCLDCYKSNHKIAKRCADNATITQ
jgi:hypothetical protein